MAASRSATLRIHGWCTSPFTQKVVMAFLYKGVDFAWTSAPLMSHRELKRRTGLGQVPVLQVDDTWIGDSTRILRWLEGEFRDPSILPARTRERMLALAIEDWADEGIAFHAYAAYWCPPGNARRLVERARLDAPGFDSAVGGRVFATMAPRMFRKLATLRRSEEASRVLLGEQLDMLDQLLADSAHLVGDTPTVADFAVAGQLLNLLDLERHTWFDARPHLLRMVSGLADSLPERFRTPSSAPAQLFDRSERVA